MIPIVLWYIRWIRMKISADRPRTYVVASPYLRMILRNESYFPDANRGSRIQTRKDAEAHCRSDHDRLLTAKLCLTEIILHIHIIAASSTEFSYFIPWSDLFDHFPFIRQNAPPVQRVAVIDDCSAFWVRGLPPYDDRRFLSSRVAVIRRLLRFLSRGLPSYDDCSAFWVRGCRHTTTAPLSEPRVAVIRRLPAFWVRLRHTTCSAFEFAGCRHTTTAPLEFVGCRSIPARLVQCRRMAEHFLNRSMSSDFP